MIVLFVQIVIVRRYVDVYINLNLSPLFHLKFFFFSAGAQLFRVSIDATSGQREKRKERKNERKRRKKNENKTVSRFSRFAIIENIQLAFSFSLLLRYVCRRLLIPDHGITHRFYIFSICSFITVFIIVDHRRIKAKHPECFSAHFIFFFFFFSSSQSINYQWQLKWQRITRELKYV